MDVGRTRIITGSLVPTILSALIATTMRLKSNDGGRMMYVDNLFRWMLVGVVAPAAAIDKYHRIRAQATKEPLDRMQEGLFILIGLRLMALVTFVVMFAYMIRPSTLAWASFPLPVWARWIGVVLGVPFIWR